MEAAMRYLIYFFVSVLMIGGSCSEKAEEKAAQKIAEKAIEAQTGHKADIDVGEERMRIRTEDGEMTVTSGKAAKLPDKFPEDIPICEGCTLEMAMELAQGYSLSFTTKADASKVSQWYLNEMIDKGWTKEAFMEMGKQTMLVFKKGERGVNLAISHDNDQTRIALTNVKG
jgi:hypothetical protein